MGWRIKAPCLYIRCDTAPLPPSFHYRIYGGAKQRMAWANKA